MNLCPHFGASRILKLASLCVFFPLVTKQACATRTANSAYSTPQPTAHHGGTITPLLLYMIVAADEVNIPRGAARPAAVVP